MKQRRNTSFVVIVANIIIVDRVVEVERVILQPIHSNLIATKTSLDMRSKISSIYLNDGVFPIGALSISGTLTVDGTGVIFISSMSDMAVSQADENIL